MVYDIKSNFFFCGIVWVFFFTWSSIFCQRAWHRSLTSPLPDSMASEGWGTWRWRRQRPRPWWECRLCSWIGCTCLWSGGRTSGRCRPRHTIGMCWGHPGQSKARRSSLSGSWTGSSVSPSFVPGLHQWERILLEHQTFYGLFFDKLSAIADYHLSPHAWVRPFSGISNELAC